MYKTKLIASILLIAAVLFAQVGVVAAAPAQDPTGEVTIQTIVPEKDAGGVITVLVTYTDALGATQTVRITEAGAVTLGLLKLDEVTGSPIYDETTGLPLVDDTKLKTNVTIDPGIVVPDQPVEEVPVHPIAALLAEFFDVDGSVIDGYHQDGYGFGLIAQALWMSKNIGETEGGEAELAGCILEARQSGTYGECFDFGDDPVPTNWGQFKKVYSEKKNNLGVVVSGKAEKDETTNPASLKEHGNGKEKNEDKGNNGNGHGKP
jgi:hypothetical protein